MVKKTELREGWIFLFEGKRMALTNEQMLHFLALPGKRVPLYPLPLSVEVLIQGGFVRRGRYLDFYVFSRAGYMSLRYRVFNRGGGDYLGTGELNDGSCKAPKYFHQLQALHMALLGKDWLVCRDVVRLVQYTL